MNQYLQLTDLLVLPLMYFFKSVIEKSTGF